MLGVVVMRRREGRALGADIPDQLKRMLGQINLIKSRTSALLKDSKGKMTSDEFFLSKKQ